MTFGERLQVVIPGGVSAVIIISDGNGSKTVISQERALAPRQTIERGFTLELIEKLLLYGREELETGKIELDQVGAEMKKARVKGFTYEEFKQDLDEILKEVRRNKEGSHLGEEPAAFGDIRGFFISIAEEVWTRPEAG